MIRSAWCAGLFYCSLKRTRGLCWCSATSVVWPLNRQPVPLPKDMSLWPSVDIFVPTYNEDLNVVKNTIYASLGIDWPKDKLNIWIMMTAAGKSFASLRKTWG